MDVYGYPQWPCNVPEELSNTTFTSQALAIGAPSNVQFTHNLQGHHAMPAPSGTPWSVHDLPWSMPTPQPQLVEFTAATAIHGPEIPKPILHCKRKPTNIEPIIPAKQFITEEKMAAHLSGLHISSDYTSHAQSSEEMMDVLPNIDGSSSTKGRTIVLSEEIKNFSNEPLLPPELIERLEQPCMSLMVWKPKEEIIKSTITDEERKMNTDISRAKVKRTGVLVPEYNVMDLDLC